MTVLKSTGPQLFKTVLLLTFDPTKDEIFEVKDTRGHC